MKNVWTIIEVLLIYIGIQLVMGSVVMIINVPFAIASCLANILAVSTFLALRFCRFSTSYIKEKPWQEIGLCLVIALTTLLPSMYFQELMPQLPDTTGGLLASMMTSPLGFVAIALLAPVVEETAFRGIILKSLLSTEKLSEKPWWAIVISAIIFAVVHMNPVQMPHAFLMGILFGWIYYRTRSIVPGILMHFINNTIAFVLYQYYPKEDTKLVEILGNNAAVGIGVGVSVGIFIAILYKFYKTTNK